MKVNIYTPALIVAMALTIAPKPSFANDEPVKFVTEYNRIAEKYNSFIQDISAAEDAAKFDEVYHDLKQFIAQPGTDKYSDTALCIHLDSLPMSELSYLESIVESPDNAISLKKCQTSLLNKLNSHALMHKTSLDLEQEMEIIKPLAFEEREVSDIAYLSMQGLNPKEVMLTFDDGPTQRTTLPILAALKKAGVKAAFFSTGRQASFNKDLVKKILDEGHLLGSHSYYHTLMMGREVNRGNLSYDYFMNEFVGGHLGVFLAGGYIDPYFRFPNGCMNRNMKNNVSELGLKIFGWSIDSFDWKFTARAYPDDFQRQRSILQSFVKALKASNDKGIILMHDVFRQSAEALPLILRYLADNDFKVVLLTPKERDRDNINSLPLVSQALDYMRSEGLKLKDIIPPSKNGSEGSGSSDFVSKVRYQQMFPQLSYQYSPVDPMTKSCGE